MSLNAGKGSFYHAFAEAQLRSGPGSTPSLVSPPGAQPCTDATLSHTEAALAGLLRAGQALLAAVRDRGRGLLEQRREAQRNRRLRVLETVALGEKRFLAIVQVRDQEFLVGSSASGVSLLTCLGAQADPAAAAGSPTHATGRAGAPGRESR